MARRKNSKVLIALAMVLFGGSGCKETPKPQSVGTPPSASNASSQGPGTSLGIASVPNLRDMGGYRTSDGATMRWKILYRSNQLKDISPDDMKKLTALGLKNGFDLRTAAERDEAPDELPPGVNNVWLNVLADVEGSLAPAEVFRVLKDPARANDLWGRGKLEAAAKGTYRSLIRLPSAIAAYRQFYRALAESGGTPALFHCTAGKDRTGWAAAALLTLLGVPKKTVMQDYLRSNDYVLPHYKNEIDSFVAKGGEPGIMPALFGVKAEYIEAAFDQMQRKYGTIDKYFSAGLGIDAAGQKALRAVFLEAK